MVAKVCECCGTQYSVKPSRAGASRFCSKACESKASQVIKKCRQCFKPFTVKASAADKIHFCSAECRTLSGRVSLTCRHCGDAYSAKASQKDRSAFCSMSCKTAGGGVEKVCECCGKSFTVPRRRSDEVRFCSIECKTNGRRKTLACEFCKKPFSCELHVERKFCSRACFHAAEKPSGESHYLWKGETYQTGNGYVRLAGKGAGMQHRAVLLTLILGQAPDHPFLVEVEGQKIWHKDIDVHHIDRNRSNNELSNLLAVTRSAHLLIHHRNRKPDPWECWPPNPDKW